MFWGIKKPDCKVYVENKQIGYPGIMWKGIAMRSEQGSSQIERY